MIYQFIEVWILLENFVYVPSKKGSIETFILGNKNCLDSLFVDTLKSPNNLNPDNKWTDPHMV